ncbi:MAG TPA: cysteine desulfurase family protein [Candidatus Acidoferrales bacterium]|nr:cysteine desulfurase family protein [Candidatus Acidoferrales bacterium]
MSIYLDHAATTPPRREVLDAMLPVLAQAWGNPSSTHAFGRSARVALDDARESVAHDLGADPREVVFTSGGTEAINLAIKGAAWAGKQRGHHLVTSAAEHEAVLNSMRYLEKFGFEVTLLPVDRYGRVDPDELSAAITDRTVLVSLQYANNEVGTVQPIAELVRRARVQRHVTIHLDAVQGAPWVDLDTAGLDVDLMSIAGHKLEGPKGIGALYVRRGTALLVQQQGGSQERHRRAGTENVAGAVGLARALRLAHDERATLLERVEVLRDRLRDAVLAVPGVELTGHPRDRIPGHLSVIVRDADGQSLVLALDLDGIACSSGSACASGSTEPSHVLTAMGYPPEEARGALRLSLGRTTTADEIEMACRVVPATISRVREGMAALTADPLGRAAGGR